MAGGGGDDVIDKGEIGWDSRRRAGSVGVDEGIADISLDHGSLAGGVLFQ